MAFGNRCYLPGGLVLTLSVGLGACRTMDTGHETLKATAAADQGDSLGLGEEYDPPPANETALAEQISKIFQGIVAAGYAGRKDTGDERPARRDAHAKHHGCVKADFTVMADLPTYLRKGVFETPHTYQAWIRLSNGNFMIKDDRDGDAHGMAIKLMGVTGEKLLNAEEAMGETTTQDFVMIDNPVFFMREPDTYISFTMAQKDGPAGLQQWAQKHPYEWGLIQKTVTKKPASPLASQYWSQTPYRLGDGQAIKFTAKPCDPAAITTLPEGERGEDFLKDSLKAHLVSQPACFDFMVQVQTDAKLMPVEDPTIQWPDTQNGQSTWQKVAEIAIPAHQETDSPERMRLCEDMSFSPWHSLPDHRPLGGVNRVRRQVYVETSRYRHSLNKAPFRVPTATDWEKL